MAYLFRAPPDCKGHFLYMGGKIILIQSVLSALPIHILAVLKSPMKVLKRIEKAFSVFFGGDVDKKAKKSWIAWEFIKPREEDGLGIKSLKEVMQALHAKLTWVALTTDSLLAQFMLAKYVSATGEAISAYSGKASPLWKEIVDSWDFVQSNIFLHENKCYWKLTYQGQFTTKSVWKNLRNSAATWSIAIHVWKSFLPMKMSIFFFWKL